MSRFLSELHIIDVKYVQYRAVFAKLYPPESIKDSFV